MAQLLHSFDYSRQVAAAYFADKPVRRVEVFGSYARGEATAESDLDLLLSRQAGSKLSLFDLGHYRADLEQQLGIPIDLGTALPPFSQRYIESDLRTVYEQVA